MNLRRIARSLVTVLALSLVQIAFTPVFQNSAHAYTQGTVTNGTSTGGGGGGPSASNLNCSNGAIVAIGTTKSGDNLNTFMFVCKTINDDASLSATEVTTNAMGTPSESDRCVNGQVGIGIRAIASNGGTLVGGVGLICGNIMSQGNPDTRSIMPNASSPGTVTTYTCPTGQLLAGFAFRTGALVDQITPKCSSFTGFVYAAVGAPTATVTGSTASISFATVSGSIADTPLTYTVTAVPNSGSTIVVTGSSSPISVPNLVFRTNYTVTVTASNTYGTSSSTSSTSAAMALPGGDTDTALTLSGSNFAQAPANAALNAANSFTIQAWTLLTSYNSSNWNMVINKESSYELGISGGFWTYAFLGTSWTGVSTGIPYELNVWHHVAVTRLAGENIVKFYLDGALVFTGSADGVGTGSVGTSTYPLTIGGRSPTLGSATAPWTGQLDEVRLFSTVRTAAEIASDMHTYLPPSTPGLQYYYDFNEGTGSTVYNRKELATSVSDLTLYNSPTWSDVKDVSSSALTNYTITTFDRTYITSTGGWRVPSNVPALSALIVAGGGGGGYNSGGGGAGGGVLYLPRISPTGVLQVTVGAGGVGSSAAGSTPADGGASLFGSNSVSGGTRGTVYPASQIGGAGIVTATGTSGSGGNGAASSSVSGSPGSAGVSSSVTGTSQRYGGGGGGGGWSTSTNGGAGGAGGGGSGGTTGSRTGKDGTPNTGGGGGAGSASGVIGGTGGSGIIIVRWITNSKPSFTSPRIAYLNAGMTETFTTNVAQDSATANLTRTFRWESSTTGINGTYSVIKEGTGANNAFFAWVPTNTSTSGSTFAYRVVVTDSDTSGLFIVDTSTPVWAIINPALNVSGNTAFGKAINLSRSETFTITLGTPTYRATLTPDAPGISLDTSTAGFAVIRIADTTTVGTYYETLTVTDSVSASVIIPLTINIAAPPNLINSAEITSDYLIYHLDAGNSASLLLGETATATNAIWRDISGNGKHAQTSGTYDTGGYAKTCAAPVWSPNNGGHLVFDGSSTCFWSPYIGEQLNKDVTVEVWMRLDGSTLTTNSILVQQNYNTGIAANVNYVLGDTNGGNQIRFGIYDGSVYRQTNGFTPTRNVWTHIVGTYDGSNFRLYKDGALIDTSALYTAGLGSTINTAGTLIGRRGSTANHFNGALATVRIYDKALTGPQILQNYNSTKDRFITAGAVETRLSQKYGSSQVESFTATAGYGARTTSFAVGDRTGIDWDTTTVTNQVRLSIQESLTVGTYNDTVTVTDSLGQSTFLPIRVTVSKADTITVTLRNPKVLTFTGSPAASLPDIGFTGLKSSDTATVTRLFSAPASGVGAPETYTALLNSSTVPTNVESYTVSLSAINFTVGSLSNYEGVIYETSTLRILQADQPDLRVPPYGAYVGAPYTIVVEGGAGGGAVTESVTAGSTATGCSITNDVLTITSTTQGYCNVLITKAQSRNYKSETLTVQIYFYSLVISQPAPEPGSGPNIALTGQTSVTLDPYQAPTISGLSATTISLSAGGSLTITGAGFTTSPITVKFWRNKEITVTSTNGTTLVIPFSAIAAAGATTGRIIVTTPNGQAVSVDTLTINP